MDKNNHNHTNSQGNGFLLGVIVGVIITLLFTTKRGREIVKDLTAKGLDKFGELQKVLDEKKDEFKEVLEQDEMLEEESEYLEPAASDAVGKAIEEEATSNVAILEQESKVEHREHAEKHISNGEAKHSSAKRFFLRKPAKKS